MGLFSMARASSSSSVLDQMIRAVYGGGSIASSGVTVNTETALKVGAVYSCVLVLSQSLGQLPIHLFERTASGNIQNSNHPLASLVCDNPNQWMTDFDMVMLIMAHLCLRGNSVWLPTRFAGGPIRELIPIHPDRIVKVVQDEKYRIFVDIKRPTTGEIDTIPYSKLLHFKGLSTNGFWGLNPIQYAREIIGLSIAIEKYGGKLFANGAKMGGTLTHPKKLTPTASANLENSFNEKIADIEEAHRTILLEEGVKWEKITMTAEDAQFLDSRKLQRSEIAGWYRVPSHLINDLEKATFSNVEHLDLSFVKHTLSPYCVSIEKTFRKVLMTPEEQKRFFFKFNVDGLLRGDIKSRYEALNKAVGGPWLTINEARGIEDRNSIPGGEELLKPMNMGAAANEPASTT